MEKFEKKISIQNHLVYIEEMQYFGWEVTNINKQDDGYAIVSFQRDPEMKNYEEIKKLEHQWFSYTYPPMWPMIVFSVIAFGLITALLVIWMVTKETFDAKFWLLCLGLPAFGFITLSTVWFAFRVNKMKKVLDNIDKDRKEIRAKLASLKEGEEVESKEENHQG